MNRAGARRVPAGLALAALSILAQSNQDAARNHYRTLYQTWREADPNLGVQRGHGGRAFGLRAAGGQQELAAAYSSAHAAALRETAEKEAQNLQWLSLNGVEALPDLAPPPEEIRFATREAAAVKTLATVYANDPDRAIQQLRQAIQREQAALEALKTSIVDRQQAESKALKPVSSAEQARAKAMEEYTFLSSALTQSVDSMNQETASWTSYYAKLADAARAGTAAPVTAPPSVSEVRENASPRPPSITPVPLSRYTGVWKFQIGSPSFGAIPESADLAVQEENGHAVGTFSARFRLPPGSDGDPILRFDFAGDFRNSRNQTFALKTSDGTLGTIELIPGVAFNELEVNFHTDPRPGRVQQGDVLLLKQ